MRGCCENSRDYLPKTGFPVLQSLCAYGQAKDANTAGSWRWSCVPLVLHRANINPRHDQPRGEGVS